MFSVERVRQLLATWHYKSVEQICNRMLGQMKSCAGHDELEGDTSLMIVKAPS